ncbi:MAG TPA: septum formation initiator family protein [Thermodesulfovibrionales bacterium]|nr:septum formation initiator family protein [Thermodesulfovibrionales bacterium]
MHGNLLRKQVTSELKKRRLIFFTLTLLSILYLIINVLFGDMGLIRYGELRKTKASLEAQVKEIEQDNKKLRSQLKSIKEDPFIKEKHAREDYGLAKPDELIFQYDR